MLHHKGACLIEINYSMCGSPPLRTLREGSPTGIQWFTKWGIGNTTIWECGEVESSDEWVTN